MRKAFIIITCFSICLSSLAQKTGAFPAALVDFIQTKTDSVYKAAKPPGMFIGVLNKGERKFFNYGYAVPDERMPFDSSTIFEAGSITKTFTAYMLEAVLRERKISDSSSILSYLPDSVRSNKALASITFLSLLNHTSGLPRLPENIALNNTTPYDSYTINHLFSYLKNCTPKPDGKSNYSNLGAGLAGALAQRIIGKNYLALLQQYILGPFGMRASKPVRGGRKAQGYLDAQKQPFWNMNALAPAGALQCSANEMLSYLQRMSVPKSGSEQTIIKQLLQPTAALSPTINICRAWHTFEQKGKPTIYWHNGGTYGFSTFAAFVKETGQSVIVVVNRFNSNAVSDGLGVAIIKRMLAL